MNSETLVQQRMYIWFHNTYPGLRGLLCYNLNNSATSRQGLMNKGLGLQAGRSDMVFYYGGKSYMIEVKNQDGLLSVNQLKWAKLLRSQGFLYYVVRTLEEFQKVIYGVVHS